MKKTIIPLLLFLTSISCLGQQTILWKVNDSLSENSSFLVGTFHNFGNSFVDAIPELKTALKQSELAIFESIDDIEVSRQIINSRTKTNQIDKLLKKKDLKLLERISADWEVDIYKLKPTEILFKLIGEFTKTKCKTVMPKDEWDRFDDYLIHIAKENSVPVLGLETTSFQMGLIEEENIFPEWKNKKKTISLWLNKLVSEDNQADDCILSEKYRNFDIDYALAEECEDDKILNKRNTDWMNTLPNLLKTKTCFVAVGLSHLFRKCGLIAQLKNHGFTVEPIDIK